MFRMRTFRKEDLSQVMGIVGKTLGENYDPSVYLQLAKHWPDAFLVLERGRRIIGFVLGAMNEDGSARILMLSIHPSYRRKGIGTRLMKAFMREAVRKRAKRLVLEVRITNKPAIQFYQHHGFDIRGLLQHYYTSGEDAYAMERAI